ncbi:MAG: NAD(P)/FAD-dependent oxidoreductase [Desulfatibacillaceae bacterium]|nr:NAD(P)/FAD-dependent oxidoreductase [Desulfatibacillaceae bacterium]
MKKTQFDVVIIGAGPNGLICAAYLTRAGLDVCVLEARHETGGGLDTLEFAGFKYNPHAVYHMMAEIMPVYSDFNLKDRGVRFIYPEVQAAYVRQDGPPLLFYRDTARTVAHVAKHFGADQAKKFEAMMADFKEWSDKILIPYTYVPAIPPIEMVQQLDNASDDAGRRFNEVAELTPLEMLERYGLSDPLKAGVLNLFTMWGMSPYEALGYLFPLYVYRMTNAALVCGGSHRLSSAIHKVVVGQGGTIVDSAPVAKVLTKDGKACGVVLEDGTEIFAKAVASTVDPQQNFLKFFDADEIPSDLVDAAKRWEWEKITLFGAHLALAAPPEYLGSDTDPDVNRAFITHLGVGDTQSILDHLDDLEAGKLPKDSIMGHATVASIFDPIMAPPGLASGRFECLVPYEADWEKIKWEYADACIAQWKKFAPNLEVYNKLVYPPTYIEAKIRNMVRGSIKQGAYVPLQMGYFRPNDSCSGVWTPIENFFVCGASVYPGGMIIGGPGYIGANVLCAELDAKKNWDDPPQVKAAKAAGLMAD